LIAIADTLSSDVRAQLGENLTVEDQLDRAAVGALLGVGAAAITNYMALSNPGCQYAHDPFPAPNGRFGGRPYWHPDRADEIRAWAARQPRVGVGGRPKRNA